MAHNRLGSAYASLPDLAVAATQFEKILPTTFLIVVFGFL